MLYSECVNIYWLDIIAIEYKLSGVKYKVKCGEINYYLESILIREMSQDCIIVQVWLLIMQLFI